MAEAITSSLSRHSAMNADSSSVRARLELASEAKLGGAVGRSNGEVSKGVPFERLWHISPRPVGQPVDAHLSSSRGGDDGQEQKRIASSEIMRSLHMHSTET